MNDGWHSILAKSKAALCELRNTPPIGIISVKSCDTETCCAATELSEYTMWVSKVGWANCRGARWNMADEMLRPPPHFSEEDKNVQDEQLPTNLPFYGIKHEELGPILRGLVA